MKTNNNILAITGPSMAGKTTLTNRLLAEYDLGVPRHVTTRERRIDDAVDFYRYVSLSDFKKMEERDEFLVSSGGGNRFYGILKSDCEDVLSRYSSIVLNISYKDIFKYLQIEYQKLLIVLTYKNFYETMLERQVLLNRKMELDELYKRINAAKSDHEQYFDVVKSEADCLILTDEHSPEETFQIVRKKLIASQII